MPYAPVIDLGNELVFDIYNIVGRHVVRNSKNEIVGIDRIESIPVLNYFNVPPDESDYVLDNIDLISKIVNSPKGSKIK